VDEHYGRIPNEFRFGSHFYTKLFPTACSVDVAIKNVNFSDNYSEIDILSKKRDKKTLFMKGKEKKVEFCKN